jgi:hypothetical protein
VSKPVYAYTAWKTNAHLIEAVASLGYLQRDWVILDPTYGLGTFWRRWRPDTLIAHDYAVDGEDFRKLPYPDRTFNATAFDPPYKLNGTPTPIVDARYGVDVPTRWEDRMQLCVDGITECARVTDKILLVKCQDQVCRYEVRWQTRVFADHAEAQGFRLVDRFDRLGSRAQPGEGEGTGTARTQRHARRNSSTLLVLQRG